MKKIIVTVLIAASSIVGYAQETIATTTKSGTGLYVGLGGNLGFSIGGRTFGGNTILNTDATGKSSVTSERLDVSLGAGIAPMFQVGYMFSRNMGMELGIGYLFGSKFESTLKENYEKGTGTSNSSQNKRDYTSTSSIRVNTFFLNPSVVVRASSSRIVPYGKFGLFVGLAPTSNSDSKSIENNYYNSNVLSSVGEGTSTSKISSGIALGITGAFGVDFMLTDNLAVFVELNVRAAGMTSTDGTSNSENISTNYSSNGTKTTSVSKSESVTKFVNSYTSPTTPVAKPADVNGNQPGEESIKYSGYGTSGYQEQTISSFDANGNSTSNTKRTETDLSSALGLSSVGFSVGLKYYMFK